MMIGSMYAGGQGVAKSAAARPWFERAAALGNGAAREWIASNDECPAGN
jgi:TPR repeat protein